MAIDAGRIATVCFEAFADGLPIGEDVIRRDGAGVARGWRNDPAEHAAKDPVAAFDGARAEWRGGAGEDCAQTEQAAATIGVHVFNLRDRVREEIAWCDAV